MLTIESEIITRKDGTSKAGYRLTDSLESHFVTFGDADSLPSGIEDILGIVSTSETACVMLDSHHQYCIDGIYLTQKDAIGLLEKAIG